MAQDRHRRTRRNRGVLRRTLAAVCLTVPVAALVWVPWYAREGPAVAGVPFFYWYQLAWVPGSVLAMLAAHLVLRPVFRPRPRPEHD